MTRSTFPTLTLTVAALVLANAAMAQNSFTNGVNISDSDGASADLFVNDSASVSGFLCVGFDCTDGYAFGGGTTAPLIIQDIIPAIELRDTNNAGNFWNIGANAITPSFRITDFDNGTTPFKISNAARENSFVIGETTGFIGLGTLNPEAPLHLAPIDTNVPFIQFESSTQDWDLFGNNGQFGLLDATAGTAPFVIEQGAPTSTLVIDDNGKVGIGTAAPDYPLHVKRSDGTAQFRVEETSTGAGNLSLMFLDNAGGRARLQMKGAGNAAQTGDWSISAGDTFVLQERVAAFNVMIVDQAGNMTVGGALTQNSDKNAKMAILPVDPDEILAKVAALPISAWTYKNDAESGIRHIGPMAQDFYAAFETGAGPTGISTIDTSGVALAAIKALAEENKALMVDVKGLSVENAAQRDLIAQLVTRLDALEGQIAK
jgi:hypothetical protein